MDKNESGKIFIQNGFSHPNSIMCNLKNLIGNDPMPYPYVIKPNDNGSSVGVAIITNELEKNEYIQGIISSQTCSDEKNKVLVQEFIEKPKVSGVIFTRNINDNSPYCTINYDTSGKTDLITSGNINPTMKTLSIFKDNIEDFKFFGKKR